MSELFWLVDAGGPPPPPPVTTGGVPQASRRRTRKWEFILARSGDLTRLGTLRAATQRRLSMVLNEPGSFSCSLPIDDAVAEMVETIATCVIVTLDGTPIWSGPVWTLRSGGASRQITLSCVGWYEQLNHRFLRVRKVYTLLDAGAIVSDLLAHVNSISPTWITAGNIEVSQVRSGTYDKYSFVGRLIKDLSDVEAGFDMQVDPATRKLDIYATKMVDRPGVVFGWGMAPHNLIDVQETDDGSTTANYVVSTGQLGAGKAEDIESQVKYGLWEDSKPLSDVVAQQILTAFAGVEVALRRQPRITYELTPAMLAPESQLPMFGRDFFLGDKIYFGADQGRLQVPRQAQRVFGVDLSWDQEGNDTLSALKTSP